MKNTLKRFATMALALFSFQGKGAKAIRENPETIQAVPVNGMKKTRVKSKTPHAKAKARRRLQNMSRKNNR